MKKIFLFLTLFICLKSFGQGSPFPATQSVSTEFYKYVFKGGLTTDKGLINATYTDTTAANLGYIDFYPGAQIYTSSDGHLWKRNSTATAWQRIAMFTDITGGVDQNFANADLTSTGDRYHDFNGTDRLVIDRMDGGRFVTTTTSYLRNVATDGTDSAALTVFRNGVSTGVYGLVRRPGILGSLIMTEGQSTLAFQNTTKNYFFQAGPTNAIISANSFGGGEQSFILVHTDSIMIRPFEGWVNFDTLAEVSSVDTSKFKPTAYSAATGEFRVFPYWSGGGGGSGVTGFTDGSGFDGTVTGSNLSLTTSLTTGSVPFIGASGALTQDNANFFWDDGNNRLGVGTATPGMKIDVVGGSIRADSYLYAGDKTTTYGGYVGVILGDASNHSLLDFWDAGSRVAEFYTDATGFNFFTDVGKTLSFYTDNDFSAPLIFGSTTQRVGINTPSPSSTLHVNGIITTENHLVVKEGAAPSTPASTRVNIYAKADGLLYGMDDAGTEVKLSNDPASPNTFGNGLTNTAGSIGLGGTLTGTTAIDINSQAFSITSATGTTALNISNSSSGIALSLTAVGSNALTATSTNSTSAVFVNNPASTNSFSDVLAITRNTSGTAANNIGGAIKFYVETSTGATTNEAGMIGFRWQDVTNATRTSQGVIQAVNSTTTQDVIYFEGNGRTRFNGRAQFLQGADVASVAGAIAVGLDGNVFELTGTNAVTLISNVNWQNGSVIVLFFTSTASLTDGIANSGTDIGLELAGNINFTGSAGASITLRLSEIGGTQRWREVSRSVN